MSGQALFYQANVELPLISHAKGVYMWDEQGKRYLDGCSGAITCNLGHQHPAVLEAMQQQMHKVAFSYRTQFESQVAIDLAEELVRLSDQQLQKVFFVGSGSEAVESAIKLARQYFFDLGEVSRKRFVTLRPSYHGSTLGALGLTGYQPLEAPFADLLQSSIKVPSPDFYRSKDTDPELYVEKILQETAAILDTYSPDSIAAFVLEPVGGASTGARVLTPSYVKGIKALCDRIGCLLIMDEVMTGIGRTGTWFGWQQYGVCPDIIALAKGMGAGYYPVAAILAKESLVDVVQAKRGFMHGHTYAGNPLACATGLAVLRAMQAENILENVTLLSDVIHRELKRLQAKYACVGDVRGIGFLWALELVADPVTKTAFPPEFNAFNKVTQLAKQNGLLIYPRRCLNGLAGDHFLVTPPLNITAAELDELLVLLDKTLSDFSQRVKQEMDPEDR